MQKESINELHQQHCESYLIYKFPEVIYPKTLSSHSKSSNNINHDNLQHNIRDRRQTSLLSWF